MAVSWPPVMVASPRRQLRRNLPSQKKPRVFSYWHRCYCYPVPLLLLPLLLLIRFSFA